MSANYTNGTIIGNTNGTAIGGNTSHHHGTIIDDAVGALYKAGRDDHKVAVIVLFAMFLILTQVICIIRDCKGDRKRKGYTRGTISGEEGIELVVKTECEDATI